jgi:GNAT superfamily N-acetyltransferase
MFKLLPAHKEDLQNIALCHKLCFKDSLSTQLGMPYIKRSFEWFLSKENCFLYYVLKDDIVVGYCGGFIPQHIGDGSTSGIMQYTMREATVGIIQHPWLLFHREVTGMYPLIFKNIKKKIFKKKTAKTPVQPVAAFDKRVGLVVIGVHPAHRGLGVFQMLMQEFEKRALGFHIHKLVLTVKKQNKRAINAYLKQGWFIAAEGPSTLEMNKHLQ